MVILLLHKFAFDFDLADEMHELDYNSNNYLFNQTTLVHGIHRKTYYLIG